jgi:hypothetical protein
MTDAMQFEYGVTDVARALMMNEKDVRRVLRRLHEPKMHYRQQYRWTHPSVFTAICHKVRAAAYPFEIGHRTRSPLTVRR